MNNPADNLVEKIAVIKTGGRQFKVKEGDVLTVPRLKEESDNEIEWPDILAGRKVKVKILERSKGKKVMILKFRHKTRYTRKKGARQIQTKIKILEIK